MPFIHDGQSAESNYVDRQPARLLVSPDKVLFVKRGFEDEADRIATWVYNNAHRLNSVPPPGADPCSEHAALALSENGQTAIDAALGYVRQLRSVAQQLGDIAQAYGLVEDQNTQKFTQGSR